MRRKRQTPPEKPHELDILTHRNGEAAVTARVERIQSAGPQVRIELSGPAGEMITVELSHERYREMTLTRGQQVYVTPRQARVFLNQGEGI